MLNLVHGHKFEKDLKRAQRRGHNLEKIATIIDLLANGENLPSRVLNHKLKGDYKDCWECHIEHDWLLIYQKTLDSVVLIRTSTHADLF